MQELQSERDLLQEKMSEQIMRITSIQSRLDEQRQRAEELQRAGTSDLNLKVYDLQTELNTLRETLSAREKQINVLKNHLAQSKEIIDKQEMEIALATSVNATTTENSRLDKLVAEIEAKNLENKNLRDKMRTEMITKIALPDLMETMLADKTDEIDYLKEQLEARERELKSFRERQLLGSIEEKFSFKFAKDSASSSNDFSENDHTRRLPEAPQDIVTSLTMVCIPKFSLRFDQIFVFNILIFIVFRSLESFFQPTSHQKSRKLSMKNLHRSIISPKKAHFLKLHRRHIHERLHSPQNRQSNRIQRCQIKVHLKSTLFN